jgi:hypothetical protein
MPREAMLEFPTSKRLLKEFPLGEGEDEGLF